MPKIDENIQQICDILLSTKQQVTGVIEENEYLSNSDYTKGTAIFDKRRERLLEHLKQGRTITGFELERGGSDLTFTNTYQGIPAHYRFFSREWEKEKASARKWLNKETRFGMNDLFDQKSPAYYGVFFDKDIAGESYVAFELRDENNKLLIDYIHGVDEVVCIDELSMSARLSKQPIKATFIDKKQKKIE